MPQPIPFGNLSYSPNPTWIQMHCPWCPTHVGMVALAWTRVEHELGSMVSGVLGRTGRGEDGGWGINPNWIAQVAMQEAETIRNRIKIANAVLTRVLEGHPLKDEWDALSAQLFKRAKERNKIVHTPWSWSEQHPTGVVRHISDESMELWVEADFAASFGRIREMETTLHLFMRKVLDAIHSGSVTRFISPEMIMS